MKAISLPRFIALLAVGLTLFSVRAGAQGFEVSVRVTGSANPPLVNTPITYSINVTNLTGILLPNTFVTNTLPPAVNFLSATNSQGVVARDGQNVVFSLGQFLAGDLARLAVTARPTVAGFITNRIDVVSTAVTNNTTTNIVTQVITAQADLRVRMTGVTTNLVVNDPMTYSVTATNAGPNAAPNVILSNNLPASLLLKVAPTGQAYTFTNHILIFNLGTLTNGATRSFMLTVQPTNAGVLTFSASVTSAGLLDPNPTNSTAGTNVTVINYLSGQLTVVTNSPQQFNPQNGFMEQSILMSNVGTNPIASARVIVTGLSNRLVNAVGTNNGSPYVVFNSSLQIGASVNLLLQYFAPNRTAFPFTNSQLQAREVPLVTFAPPTTHTSSTSQNITRLVTLTNGNLLLEFPSIAGRTYSVVYADNVLFSNAQLAPPSLVAPADRSQWIDYGPPTTMSAPMNTTTRFYRIILNP